jgi:hypothetical protein
MHAALTHPALAALVSLNKPAKYVHWHFFQMSVANIVVIVLMIAVFVLAIMLPFPAKRRTRS